MSKSAAIEIAQDTYWIGSEDACHNLHCNSYLIKDGDEAILIDPGPVLTYQAVAAGVQSILPIEDLIAIVLLHQDPDVAGATPLFEKAGFRGKIVSTWRTAVIASYYGIRSPFHLLDLHNQRISFSSGKEIQFIPAPYLHFPGAVMAYDPNSAFLFSGDLFGAFSKDQNLYAEDTYLEDMKAFHREYMPGNEIIRPVMELLLTKQIATICPQHGSIIRTDIGEYIRALRDLECGLFLTDVKKQLAGSEEKGFIVNLVLERLIASFSLEEVLKCFQNSPLEIDPQSGEGKVPPDGFQDAWNLLFNQIYAYGGHRWLAIVEPLLARLEQEFSIRRPDIFYSLLIREKQKTTQLLEEKEYLESVNASLRGNLDLAMEEMTKDQLTGLYNETFLVKYLLNIFNESGWKDFIVYFIHIDHMKQLNESIGEQKGNEIITRIGSLLLNRKNAEDYLFRIGGPVFALVSPRRDTWEEHTRHAEELRNIAAHDRGFLERITISVGIVSAEYAKLSALPAPAAMEHIFSTGRMMLRAAARNGGNRVEMHGETADREANLGRVVIIEYDDFHARLIGDALESLSIDYRICMNGPEALHTIADFHPDVIVSELFLLETDAFSLKEELDQNSKTSRIPFILVSHQKNESTVIRAVQLGITHYLRKPYMLPELLGVINTYVIKTLSHAL